jgi:hypothetical protein
MHFYARQTMQTLFRGLEAAFEFFGGVSAELLFDQMSAVVTKDRRNDGGTLSRTPSSCASRIIMGLSEPRRQCLGRAYNELFLGKTLAFAPANSA